MVFWYGVVVEKEVRGVVVLLLVIVVGSRVDLADAFISNRVELSRSTAHECCLARVVYVRILPRV